MIQMSELPETEELRSFAKAVEARSLTRAAAELGVPRATLARRLARLEEKLGVRLLRRTTRALALTDAGAAFELHARIVLDAIGQAAQSVRVDDRRLRGTLRIAVPPQLDDSFHAMVCAFAEANPDVRVHLDASARFVDLVREGYDVALRAAGDLDAGFVARTLARTSLGAVASPAYLRANGVPARASDLRAHRCLLGFGRGEVAVRQWPLAAGGKVTVDGTFVSNDVSLLASAARRGLGIALVPTMLVMPLLRRGLLVPVLPDVVRGEVRVSVVYPERELVPPQVRAFVEAVVAWAPEGLAEARVEERCREEQNGRAGREKRPARPTPVPAPLTRPGRSPRSTAR